MEQTASMKLPEGDHFDDLTVIPGIGGARQQWIREAFDVRTYGDLAALSLDEIVAQMKRDRKIASVDVIESWLEQAHELAGKQARWKTLATFVVEFGMDRDANYQTRVHHMDKDRTLEWSSIEPYEVGEWIKTRLESHLHKLPEVATTSQEVQEPVRAAIPSSPHDRLHELIAKVAALKSHDQPELRDVTPMPVHTDPIPHTTRMQRGPEKRPRIRDELQSAVLPADIRETAHPLYSEKLLRYIARVREFET